MQQQIRTFLTSKHHGFSRFKAWKGLHWLLLEVECVTNLGFLYILHPRYYVADLACKPKRQSTSEESNLGHGHLDKFHCVDQSFSQTH